MSKKFQLNGKMPLNNKKKKKKKRRLKKGVKRFLSAFVGVAAMACIALAAVLLLTGDTYTLDDGSVHYYNGNTYTIQDGSELKLNSDGDTVMIIDGNEESTTNLPIYNTNETSVVVPVDMTYYAPRTNVEARVKYFSKLTMSGSQVYVESDGNRVAVSPGFLYDGKDIYVFLEDVTLSFNGYTMELSAFSYVEAVYSANIMVFDYGTKEYLTDTAWGDVVVTAGGGDYSVYLLGDYLMMGDTKILLFNDPSQLDLVE